MPSDIAVDVAVGDGVELNSGGPLMTIVEITTQGRNGGTDVVAWWRNAEERPHILEIDARCVRVVRRMGGPMPAKAAVPTPADPAFYLHRLDMCWCGARRGDHDGRRPQPCSETGCLAFALAEAYDLRAKPLEVDIEQRQARSYLHFIRLRDWLVESGVCLACGTRTSGQACQCENDE